eukprot:TRINITY_DN454_c0_g1_i3.p1 TRINITY_DN454_c0_g1~~TRINITY_DN454_c0_g1_i3.p1  ORF type:complete len:254 (+),score=84.80 TRINITY_DN454_c0_g1_i3:38-763(+)
MEEENSSNVVEEGVINKIDKVVLPGDVIANWTEGKPFRVGPGLLQNQDKIIATKAGILRSPLPKYFWVECNQKRYTPSLEDMVIGVIKDRHGDNYKVDIGSSQLATLSILSFEAANRKNRINIKVGSLIYARVILANKDMEPELACVSARNKQEGYGELYEGYMFKSSLGLAYKLLEDDCTVLKALSKLFPFEIAAGMNGRTWVNSATKKNTIMIASAILNSEFMEENQILQMVQQLKQEN